MNIALISIVIGALIVTGCASPKAGQWHNKLYERDYKTNMRQYYGRDFNICLSLALQEPTAAPTSPGTIERKTDECLRNVGWFKTVDS